MGAKAENLSTLSVMYHTHSNYMYMYMYLNIPNGLFLGHTFFLAVLITNLSTYSNMYIYIHIYVRTCMYIRTYMNMMNFFLFKANSLQTNYLNILIKQEASVRTCFLSF